MTEPMPMPPPEKKQDMAEPNAPKSKGERFFDRAVYGGIAGVGTFIATIPIAYELEHHPKLKPVFKYVVDKVELGLAQLPFNTTRKTAEKVVMTTTLMQGGNLMLIPIGIAEHHKVALVSGLNTAMDDPTPKDAIQHAPKQTWMSLLKSRGLAWLTVFTSLTAVGAVYKKALPTFEQETGEFVTKLFGKQTHRIIDGVKTETRTFGYGKIAALDVFATSAAATLLYIGGHFFARKQEEKKEHKLERKLAQSHEAHSRENAEELSAHSDADVPASQIDGGKHHAGKLVEQQLLQQV